MKTWRLTFANGEIKNIKADCFRSNSISFTGLKALVFYKEHKRFWGKNILNVVFLTKQAYDSIELVKKI